MKSIDRKFVDTIFGSSIMVVGAAFVGNLLDRVLHTQATFLGLFLLAAFGVGAYLVGRLYRNGVRDAERAEREKDVNDRNRGDN